MPYGFVQWDADTGVFKAGQIRRASSSNDKVWGEKNSTDVNLGYGTFVAVNADGGVKKITASTDVVHGIVVRDIYVDNAPSDRQVNIGHFSHGDSVVAQATSDAEFTRGTKVYIVATGDDAGKVTNVATDNIATGYWVEEVSADLVAITLGYGA